jgi:DNA polymerase III gamma/tau subunit
MSEYNLAEKLANEHRPKFFKDYVGQGNGIGGPVDVIKNIISKNLHSQVGNLGIFGSSGTGKSSLSMLYSKATLCYNRLEGEFEPCGYCPVCLGEDVSNNTHYTITNSSDAWQPLRNLIELSRQSPINITNKSDRLRRIITIDEIENASPELLSMLFDALEFAPSSTTWVLISMDIEKLALKNIQAAEAITGRVGELILSKFTDDSIASNLTIKLPDLNYEAALAIAKISIGNMRKAWQNLALCLTLVPLEELTEELVLTSRTGGAISTSRQAMWKALGEGDGKQVKTIIDEWLSNSSDVKLLGNLLQKDIIDNLDTPSDKMQSLLAAIGRWSSCGMSYPLNTVLMSYLGTNVIQTPIIELKETKPKSNPLFQVQQQLTKVAVNKLNVPILLAAKSYKELVLHYQGNRE